MTRQDPAIHSSSAPTAKTLAYL